VGERCVGLVFRQGCRTIDLIRAILARNRAALALGIILVLLVAARLSVTAAHTDLAAERARMVTTIEAKPRPRPERGFFFGAAIMQL
jgi:hypothetical protein